LVILVDENTQVLVQGITGRDGTARTKYMLDYGTKIVAGVTPGRGGRKVYEVPVYDTVKQAWESHGPIDASVTFVPGPFVKDAVLEALDGGIKLIVVPTERVPLHDILEMVSQAKKKVAKIIGPGSIGIISTGRVVLGWLGGNIDLANDVFMQGNIGITSRSGFGISTCICTGSEPIVGLTHAEILRLFEEDNETKAVVMFGEIGTVAEEEAAKTIVEGEFTKPLVAYIAGRWAQEGMRFSHASAIIEHGKGSAKSKIKALKEAGAYVVDRPEEIAVTMKEIVKPRK